MHDDRDRLATVVKMQADAKLPWERAGTCLREQELRDRLDRLRIPVTAEIGVALMAAAMLLVEESPEWGGDARTVLGELAAVGLALLDDDLDQDGPVRGRDLI